MLELNCIHHYLNLCTKVKQASEKSVKILFVEAHATYISTSNFIPRSNAYRRRGGRDAPCGRRSNGMVGCSGRSGGASALQDRESSATMNIKVHINEIV